VARAVLASWTFDPGFVLGLLLLAVIYGRGWRALNRQMPDRFPAWRLASFLGGLATLIVAVASPLDVFAGLLLQVHMVQHLLLMMVAPPLLLLGAPLVPLLRGLPARVAKEWLGPFVAWPALRRAFTQVTHPVVCWLALALATWVWHLPVLYQLALRSPPWHAVEHATFLAAGLLFWWPVVQPWPAHARWPRWTIPLYLLLGDVQNTIFAAFLTFSERLLYPAYAAVPRLGSLSAFDDQVAAGVIMWVPASVIFLVPAAVITMRVLSPHAPVRRRRAPSVAPPYRRFDALRLPLLGSLLRRPVSRRVAQGVVLVAAAAVVADGLLGPAMSPMNLAGVLPWTGWRGLTVIALLAAGNVFCFACPFMLPRALARRLSTPTRRLPRWVRTKWLAAVLLVVFFWSSETFGLWDAPRATAWLIAGYFAAALVVDSRWRGASFCKYVCPIGQFQFVSSLVSPLEVAVRQPTICATCTTHDCVRGNAARRGCELELFLPRKVGNLDCTFCLDCVHACPHDNIGLLAVAPGADLVHDRRRSSIGRLSQRLDVAALALLLVVAAFVMAAAMVAPVSAPALLVLLAAPPLALASLARVPAAARERICRFVLALVPLGVTMWAAHFLFHLISGWTGMVFATERALADVGMGAGPRWFAVPGTIGAGRLLGPELLLLDVGLLLTLWVGWRIAREAAPRARRALALVAPCAGVAAALWAAGVWIVCQPMAMRGMMVH
jgi:cytochrome c oxidase assembly factor CtaG